MIGRDKLFIIIGQGVENHVYITLLFKAHIELFKSPYVSLYFLHTSTCISPLFQFAHHEDLDEFVTLLSHFLVEQLWVILVHLTRPIVLIGLLKIRYHGCIYNASNLGGVVNMLLVFNQFLRSNIFFFIDFGTRVSRTYYLFSYLNTIFKLHIQSM